MERARDAVAAMREKLGFLGGFRESVLRPVCATIVCVAVVVGHLSKVGIRASMLFCDASVEKSQDIPYRGIDESAFKDFFDLFSLSVFDADGEILLIQAAEELPQWLEDHEAKNRVFIYQGEVHIVPIPSTPSEITPLSSACDPTLVDALSTVRNFPSATRASAKVQEVISERLRQFPDKMDDQLHRANVLVPAGVAMVLEAEPSLLAPAVHAFCQRDMIDMRACQAMKFFPPEQCVRTRVTFTKCLYALLNKARCDPDPRTGWKLPAVGTEERKEAELGVKLGEIEGSKEYSRLKAEAVDYFVTYVQGGGPNLGRRTAAGKEIHKRLSKADINVDRLRERGENLPESEDDSWLDVNTDQLDAMLKRHFNAEEPNAAGESIPDSLKLFLSQMSSYEGVENAGRKRSTVGKNRKLSRISDRKKSAADGRKISSISAVSNLSEAITFDGEQFSAGLRDILDLEAEDEGDFDSDWSEDYSSEDEFEDVMDNAFLHPGKNRKISEEQREIMRIMAAMDNELMTPGNSVMADSFVKKVTVADKYTVYSAENKIREPVDVEGNAMKNILESFENQLGLTGPATTLIASMNQLKDS
ncbi:unnamed protein product [Notodromas monacha]|uniref:Uncharacterized protein n=1 Tax=Notodromas monacha TaxID=399045 RepID=A0A7R9BKI1_9CRUS|nr:unnamed protein product [Notodromas monacha]CAG0916384.1 unnamed protein product [Notodromas monacha]